MLKTQRVLLKAVLLITSLSLRKTHSFLNFSILFASLLLDFLVSSFLETRVSSNSSETPEGRSRHLAALSLADGWWDSTSCFTLHSLSGCLGAESGSICSELFASTKWRDPIDKFLPSQFGAFIQTKKAGTARLCAACVWFRALAV